MLNLLSKVVIALGVVNAAYLNASQPLFGWTRSDLRKGQVYEVLGVTVDAEFGGEPCLIVSPDRPASVRRFRKIVTQSNECRLEAINV